jgi:hypothetical protein
MPLGASRRDMKLSLGLGGKDRGGFRVTIVTSERCDQSVVAPVTARKPVGTVCPRMQLAIWDRTALIFCSRMVVAVRG